MLVLFIIFLTLACEVVFGVMVNFNLSIFLNCVNFFQIGIG
jgi:hypothetical protein